MKRYLATLLALVLLLTGLAAVVSAEGYVSSEEVIWEDGIPYLADTSTGKIIEFTGWREVTFGYEYEDGWTDTWTSWFYSEGKGKLVEGWKQIGGVWYYFSPEMCTSSYYDQDKDTVYLFNKKGAWTGLSATGTDGWFKQGNKWYYIQKDTDQWEGKTYVSKWFCSNGNYEIDDKCYYFKDGVMQDSGWISYKGTNYTSWYYANPNGELATGWKQIGGKWYYFSDWGWMYNDGLYWINEKFYAFEKSGTMKANQWHSETWTDEGTTYTDWFYLGADGAAKTGWFKVGKDWYYADEWGWMYSDWPLEDNGSWYYLKDSGKMAVSEWIQNGGDWFYYKANGAKAENEWIQDGSAWYYLGEEGAMYHSGTYTINGKEYKFADNGVWIP